MEICHKPAKRRQGYDPYMPRTPSVATRATSHSVWLPGMNLYYSYGFFCLERAPCKLYQLSTRGACAVVASESMQECSRALAAMRVFPASFCARFLRRGLEVYRILFSRRSWLWPASFLARSSNGEYSWGAKVLRRDQAPGIQGAEETSSEPEALVLGDYFVKGQGIISLLGRTRAKYAHNLIANQQSRVQPLCIQGELSCSCESV